MTKIEPIKIGQFEKLGIDEKNQLYWDNQPVITEEKIKLQREVSIAIIFGASSTVVLAIIELFRFFG